MRILVPLLGVVGCFSPHIPPELANPPVPGEPDAATVGDAPVDIDAGPDADLRTHFEYPADVAECINPNLPNRVKCRQDNDGGGMQMVVDGLDANAQNPWHAYVRFDVGNELAGKTMTSVILRVTATDDDLAPGPSTGEVFAVAAFVGSDLDSIAPAKVGGRLAANQGAVVKLEVVDFPLPAGSVTAGTPAHFGIFPTTNSGTNYWNSSGANPPRLIIDTQ